MRKIIPFIAAILFWISCTKKTQKDHQQVISSHKVLLLKVDFQTNAFIGAHIFTFNGPDTPFTTRYEFEWL